MGMPFANFAHLKFLNFAFSNGKMKVFFVVALVVMSFGGLNAAVIPEDVELTAAKREILTDEEIAKIILEVIGNSEAYGIIDIITVLPGLIRDFKPILEKYASIVLDPSLTVKEKVTAIWEETRDNMIPIIKIVGKMAAKRSTSSWSLPPPHRSDAK